MEIEEVNPSFDINAKYEEMINVSKRIVEHHEFVTDGTCEPPIFVSLAYDVENYLPKLLKENQLYRHRLNTANEFIESRKENMVLEHYEDLKYIINECDLESSW